MKLNKMLQPLFLASTLIASTSSVHAISNVTNKNTDKLDSVAKIDALNAYSTTGTGANEVDSKAVFNWTNNDQILFDWIQKGKTTTQIQKDIAAQLYSALTNGDKNLQVDSGLFANLDSDAVDYAIKLGNKELAHIILYIGTLTGKIDAMSSQLYFQQEGIRAPQGLSKASKIDDLVSFMNTQTTMGLPDSVLDLKDKQHVEAAKNLGRLYKRFKSIIDKGIKAAFDDNSMDKMGGELRDLLQLLSTLS